MEGSPNGTAIDEAVQNITGLNLKSRPVTDEQVSVGHSMEHSHLSDSATVTVLAQATSQEPNPHPFFARPRSVDGSPSPGFSFRKAKLPTFNTMLNRLVVPDVYNLSGVRPGAQGPAETPNSDTMPAETVQQLQETGSGPDQASKSDASIENSGDSQLLDSATAVALGGPTLIDAQQLSGRASPASYSKASHTARSGHHTDSEVSSTISIRKPKAAGKIRKRQQSSRGRSPSCPGSTVAPILDDPPLDPVELLSALTVYYQKQKQQRAKVKASQRAKELEIKDLEMISKSLHKQLQGSEARVAKQSGELEKYRELMPRWQDKVKKLNDFVKGLSNDHTRLRDDAHSIQQEQRNLQTAKESINNGLKETMTALQDERSQHQGRLSKAHKDVEALQETLTTRKFELMTSHHEDLVAKVAQQGDILGTKLADISELVSRCIPGSSTTGQLDGLQANLEEYLSLLRQPREAGSSPDALNDLGSSIKEVIDRISSLSAICSQGTAALTGSLRAEFDSISHSFSSMIEGSRPMSEQVADLREVKATIIERLRATEADLADSRLRANAGQDRERLLLQENATLKAEVETVRQQSRESPLQALQLHEAQRQKAEALEQLTTCQAQLDKKQTALDTNCVELTDLQRSADAAKVDVADLRSQLEAMKLEKQAVEAQALMKEGTIRAELSQACENEISRSANKFLNEIQTLRHQLSVAEKDLKSQRELVGQLQTERTGTRGRTQALQNSLASTTQKLKEQEARIKVLSGKVVIEDSQEKGAQQRRRTATEEPTSSPLTDRLAPSPVTDGRVMFPPSPLPGNYRSSYASTVRQEHKRKRVSSEHLDLGPVQSSPIKAPGTTRRKGTLRHSSKKGTPCSSYMS
ncbi:MAG: hypothetical protein Q9218_007233 [Villophora microphyllina]